MKAILFVKKREGSVIETEKRSYKSSAPIGNDSDIISLLEVEDSSIKELGKNKTCFYLSVCCCRVVTTKAGRCCCCCFVQ